MTSMSPSSVIAEDIQQASTDADNSKPTSQGKSTAHNTKHKTLLPDTEQEGKKLMSDQHNVPKAKSLDKMGSNES